jgi:hypothetical protein
LHLIANALAPQVSLQWAERSDCYIALFLGV